MKKTWIIPFLSSFLNSSIVRATYPLNIVSRKVPIEEILQEQYSEHELKNDIKFSYLPSPRTILCSYPSSGNTWCRYSLEFLTRRPATRYFFNYAYDKKSFFSLPHELKKWFYAMNPPFGVQYPDIKTDFSKPPIIKHHDPQVIVQTAGIQPLIRPSSDQFILLVRDYKELYFRKAPKTYHGSILQVLSLYFDLLMFFDAYPNSRKMLVYYEDIVFKPHVAFNSLLHFLHEDKKRLKSFVEQLTFHKNRALALYNFPQHAESLGEEGFSYTTGVSISDLVTIENEIKTIYPDLFARYLQRYKLKKQ